MKFLDDALDKIRDRALDRLPYLSEPNATHDVVCPICGNMMGVYIPNDEPQKYGQRRSHTSFCYWCSKYFNTEY
jgi:hypothetical protein